MRPHMATWCETYDRDVAQISRLYRLIRDSVIYVFRIMPMMKVTMAKTRNSMKRIFAMLAAPAAMPPKPNSAAIRATIKKTSA